MERIAVRGRQGVGGEEGVHHCCDEPCKKDGMGVEGSNFLPTNASEHLSSIGIMRLLGNIFRSDCSAPILCSVSLDPRTNPLCNDEDNLTI